MDEVTVTDSLGDTVLLVTCDVVGATLFAAVTCDVIMSLLMSCVDWAFIKLDEVDEGWLVNDEFKENNDAVMDPDAMNSDAFLAEILLLAKMAV